jgi:hypothetical protein
MIKQAGDIWANRSRLNEISNHFIENGGALTPDIHKICTFCPAA